MLHDLARICLQRNMLLGLVNLDPDAMFACRVEGEGARALHLIALGVM